MTPQTVLKVDVKELAAIEVACSHDNCGGAVTIPLSGRCPTYMKCPGCNEVWWDENSSSNAYKSLASFFMYLSKLSHAEGLPFRLQLPVIGVKLN
jgi:hypothetical protein